MAQSGGKAKKKSAKQGSKTQKRRERRFATSLNHIPLWSALIGLAGCFILGTGVFSLWIMDEPLSYASYLVAAGGLGLGISMWFGQPAETAIAVGDAGLALEDGRETRRLPWHGLRSLRLTGSSVVASGDGQVLKFSFSANQEAVSLLLKEAALRVPDAIDIDRSVVDSLPHPDKLGGKAQDVEDQVSGVRCASSEKLISLEEDARICPSCGQIFHREKMPDTCPSCEAGLKGRALRA